MSLLLLLPTELQSQILSYLGSEFFHQDLRRLTVSRSWYDLAWRVMVQHLRLSPASLVRFTQHEAVLAKSQACITSVHLSLRELEDLRLSTRTDRHESTEPDNADDINEWTAQLDSSWATLAAVLQRCPGLRRLKLEEGTEDHEFGLGQQGISIAKPLADLLSVGHLTRLEIDTSSPSYTSTSLHLCRCVNALLPSLRRLRCRMGTICENLLEPPSTRDEPLDLEELIVNLSISELSETVTSYRYPKRCQPIPGETFLQLQQIIESQAMELSDKLRRPRTVRVISHGFPSLSIFAFDALAGQRMKLGFGRLPWDTYGEVVSEGGQSSSEDGADLFDSDSSSTSGIGS